MKFGGREAPSLILNLEPVRRSVLLGGFGYALHISFLYILFRTLSTAC